MMNPSHAIRHPSGFTLVELLVALFLTFLITAGIYKGYVSYITSNEAQEQIVEMQQNLRIGMERIIEEMRRAGMNNEDDHIAGFITANASTVRFTMDRPANAAATEGNGIINGTDEDIAYTIDENFLKRSDASQWAGAFQKFIANVEALNFVYLDDNSTVLAAPLDTAEMTKIRFVRISMVVRTTKEDYRYTDNQPYKNLDNETILAAPNDHFRRRLLTREVKIRNLGLK